MHSVFMLDESFRAFFGFLVFVCGDKKNISQVPVGDCLTAGHLTQLCKVSVPLVVIFQIFQILL